MILQALYEYYQRKAAISDDVASEGFEWKEIPFVIVINDNGELVNIQNTTEKIGKKKIAKSFLVPKAEKRTVGIKANLLWDNSEYALGVNKNEKSVLRHTNFIERIDKELVHLKNNIEVIALKKFIANNPLNQLENYYDSETVNEILTEIPNVIFKLAGSNSSSICAAVNDKIFEKRIDESDDFCIISGTKVKTARLHSAIKGVRNAQTSGAALVSYNLDSFCSYGKKQNFNAPIGSTAADAYVKALNLLLGKGSNSKIYIGDTSAVFWSDKKTDFENDFVWFFADPQKDDPDKGSLVVKSAFESLYSGKYNNENENNFYILGLAPNAARISVRFWRFGKISEFTEKIKMHFDDMSIIHSDKDSDYLSLNSVLRSVVLEYKTENIPPNMAGKVVEAVLDGSIYPTTFFYQCIRRIRSEQTVTFKRAAVAKAYLNRYNRLNNKSKELKMSLDKENNNPAYRLGRLFALLEKIQEDAQPGINATIRDRYYSSASSSPATVFPILLKLKNHHLAKMDNPGRKINYEKQIGEVMNGIDPRLPSHLPLHEQGYFAVGYYHQRQSFFVKKEAEIQEQPENK
jgi:CRISPR-associated protein Csd1